MRKVCLGAVGPERALRTCGWLRGGQCGEEGTEGTSQLWSVGPPRA
jgi:hypothetical protein